MHDTWAAGRLPSLASGTPADRLPGLNALDGARAAVTFYATIDVGSVRDYMPAVPVLLPASSWARKGLRPPKLPAHLTERAADCGGYVATKVWGDYRYTPAQYVDWLQSWEPTWAAMMDYCCEPDVAGAVTRERQDRTTALARSLWEYESDRSWVWVPTIQGWHLEDYQRHARDLRPLILDMWHAYTARGQGNVFRVGIGTLCRRASTAQIRAIVRACAAELPGVGFHLWGIKLGAFKDRIALPPAVKSADSAAWNGNRQFRRPEWEASGQSRMRYIYTTVLPSYLARVEAALTAPKQQEMF